MPLVPAPGVGYADYATFGNYDSAVLWSQSSAVSTTPESSPVMNMTKYAAVGGAFLCTQGQCQVTFSWYSDPLLVFLIAERTFTLTSNIISGLGGWVIPNLGAYLQITFSNIAGGNYAMNAIAFGTNRQVPLAVSPQNSALIDVQNGFIGLGATLMFYPTDYYTGPLATWFDPGFSTWIVALQMLNTGGTWDTVNQASGTVAASQYLIWVTPLGAWRFAVTNSTGANSNYYLACVPAPTGST